MRGECPRSPFSDVDRAIAFYRDQLGFNLDHDTRAGDQRLAQLTAPGSGCSIVQQIKARADNTLTPR